MPSPASRFHALHSTITDKLKASSISKESPWKKTICSFSTKRLLEIGVALRESLAFVKNAAQLIYPN